MSDNQDLVFENNESVKEVENEKVYGLEEEPYVKLISNDGRVFEVKVSILEHSSTLKSMLSCRFKESNHIYTKKVRN